MTETRRTKSNRSKNGAASVASGATSRNYSNESANVTGVPVDPTLNSLENIVEHSTGNSPETLSPKNSTAPASSGTIELPPVAVTPSHVLEHHDPVHLFPNQKLFNRELSWIAFNQRVLCEGLDERTLLLERVKFFAIFSSNLDEFFMVRVANVKRKIANNIHRLTDDGLTPQQQHQYIREKLAPLVELQHHSFDKVLSSELSAIGVKILDYQDIDQCHQAYLTDYFQNKIFPVLTPLAIDPAHPFPYISNLSLNLAVILKNDEGGESLLARVKVPSALPRFIHIPETDDYTFVPLEQLIAHNLGVLFPGMEIIAYIPFRITRDAELDIEEEEADDLMSALQEELRRQRFGQVVRMEIANTAPPELRQKLIEELGITELDVYDISGLLSLGDLISIVNLPLPDHKDQPWRSVSHPHLKEMAEEGENQTIFDAIRQGDFLVHHPYQSFTTTVQRFIEEAASDPQVLAIKQTLYRTSGDSPIVHALIRAAEAGKQVAVLVELKARFDEANNILWARKLEDAGVHVVYGLKNLKTHTKTALVVRQEGKDLVRYVHIGTGNYNPKTARFYSDLGLFSCDGDLGADLTDLFNYLTGYSRHKQYRQLLVAPVNMRERFLKLIEEEIAFHTAGKGQGRIVAKMNSLVDPEIIHSLYRASAVGISIDLIIRGMCCLRPQVPHLSENIRVISIIGRFLEHSRIFYFNHGGNEQIFIGSADWMPRNLDTRVEVITPIRSEALIQELKHIVDVTLADNRQAWDLDATGKYTQRRPTADQPEMSCQKYFMAQGRPEFA